LARFYSKKKKESKKKNWIFGFAMSEKDKMVDDDDDEKKKIEEKKKGKDDVSSSSSSASKKDKEEKDKENELSAEDAELKERLELLVSRVDDSDHGVANLALEQLRTEIRTSTSSMTSVPKPLKFLRPHYESLKTIFGESKNYAAAEQAGSQNTRLLADILSALAMTMSSKEYLRECLHFKLLGSEKDIGSWGHEYVRHLSKEIAQEYIARRVFDEEQEQKVADDASSSSSSSTVDAVDDADDEKQDDALDGGDDEEEEEEKLNRPLKSIGELMQLVEQIVPYNMEHNAEHEACDLLMEVESLDKVVSFVDEENVDRVCLYLLSCAEYVAEPDDAMILRVALSIFERMKRLPDAMRVALKLGDKDLARSTFLECDDPLLKKQLAFLLGRERLFDVADDLYEDDNCEQLQSIVLNSELHTHFAHLGRDLGVLEAKKPEDIYKMHLVETRGGRGGGAAGAGGAAARESGVDSARANLASTYVNAFVNAGFGNDKLLADDAAKWIYRNRAHGMLAAVASLGMIHMWDVEPLLTAVDKFTHSSTEMIQAGSHLAVGLSLSGIKSEFEPALAFFDEVVNADDRADKKDLLSSSCLALAIAYAGSQRDDLLDEIKPLLEDDSLPISVLGIASLALGLIGVGSADGDATDAIVGLLVECTDEDLQSPFARFAALGLGLLYLGQQENSEIAMFAVEALSPHIAKYAQVTLQTCAYAGTGNVLEIQKLLHTCGEHPSSAKKSSKKQGEDDAKEKEQDDAVAVAAVDDDDEDGDDNSNDDDDNSSDGAAGGDGASSSSSSSSSQSNENDDDEDESRNVHQAVAVLGTALIAMGEELGSAMSLRMFDHLLQYGDAPVKQAVPLGLALLSISNPNVAVSDKLSKLSHDNDSATAHNAILGLGLIGAGTNNSRIAGMLRELSGYYAKDQNALFVVRIAQGLLHMGKGTITLDPYHGTSPRLLSGPAIAGILVVLHACLDMKSLLLADSHTLFFALACAMHPRMLQTVDENLEPLAVDVRVGQAVDVVGQAGRPKTITGFQTHKTPVLLGHGERAELATNDYLPLTNLLEGFVILTPNPDAQQATASSSSK
jgi:26S proteasome regulatory subunit N1